MLFFLSGQKLLKIILLILLKLTVVEYTHITKHLVLSLVNRITKLYITIQNLTLQRMHRFGNGTGRTRRLIPGLLFTDFLWKTIYFIKDRHVTLQYGLVIPL